jgi:chaperone modulatory protein CbpM
MTNDRNNIHSSTVLEAHMLEQASWLHVDEFCARVHVQQQWIVELVEIGALEPRGGDHPSAWAFPPSEVPRVRSMRRLVEDLGVNLSGAAIILELVEERRRLLSRLAAYGL